MRGGPNQRFLAFADPFEIDLHVDHMNLYYFVHYSEYPFTVLLKSKLHVPLSRETRISSRETKALKNCKYGCLNFLRDFYSLL